MKEGGGWGGGVKCPCLKTLQLLMIDPGVGAAPGEEHMIVD